MAVIQVKPDTMRDTIANEEILVLDFYADWCGPCRMMGPVVEELSEDLAGTATVAKYNVDDSKELAHEFDVRNIPTIIVFKKGEETARFVDVTDKDDILAAVK